MFDATVAYITALEPAFPALRFDQTRLEIDATQVGAGYGEPTTKARRAIKLAAQHGYSVRLFSGSFLAPPPPFMLALTTGYDFIRRFGTPMATS
jgi:hypothetical protein